MNNECPLCGATVAGDECNCNTAGDTIFIMRALMPTYYAGCNYLGHADREDLIEKGRKIYGTRFYIAEIAKGAYVDQTHFFTGIAAGLIYIRVTAEVGKDLEWQTII